MEQTSRLHSGIMRRHRGPPFTKTLGMKITESSGDYDYEDICQN